MRHLRPSTELRQAFQYNNQLYVTLSHIIPSITGIPFHQYVETHIFKPLGMITATYNATLANLRGHRTDGFMRSGRNMTKCKEVWKAGMQVVDKSCVGVSKGFGWWTETDGIFEAGAGGVIMSGNDMVSQLSFLSFPSVPLHTSCLGS